MSENALVEQQKNSFWGYYLLLHRLLSIENNKQNKKIPMIKCGLPSSTVTRRYSIVLPVLYFMAFIFLAQLDGGLGESPIDWQPFL